MIVSGMPQLTGSPFAALQGRTTMSVLAAKGNASRARAAAAGDVSQRKLFVRGLAWETTSDSLLRAFSQFGDIEEGAVATDRSTGKSRGYGFVTYRTAEAALRALEQSAKLIDVRGCCRRC